MIFQDLRLFFMAGYPLLANEIKHVEKIKVVWL